MVFRLIFWDFFPCDKKKKTLREMRFYPCRVRLNQTLEKMENFKFQLMFGSICPMWVKSDLAWVQSMWIASRGLNLTNH